MLKFGAILYPTPKKALFKPPVPLKRLLFSIPLSEIDSILYPTEEYGINPKPKPNLPKGKPTAR